ncbi:MAG: MFS transporter, partial [Burkholderiales bacterium PBB5]
MEAPAPAGLSLRQAVAAFLVFAFAYFLSALVRAVTATLAPVFSQELGLAAAQLGLLAGAYFLGFALMQLPLGSALDRWGAKRVLMAFLAVAVLGCVGFALAQALPGLLVSRFLVGVGVSACLMAPLTCFRHHF